MHPIIKKGILQLFERQGYVANEAAHHRPRQQLISDLRTEVTQPAERTARLEERRSDREIEPTRQDPVDFPTTGRLRFDTLLPESPWRDLSELEAELALRAERVAELEAELALRAERVAELEKARAALVEELDQHRERALQVARKLAETDREFRLGRERDARELEAARAETWELRMLAADLRQQLDGVRQERGEHDHRSNHSPATAADRPVSDVPEERGELDDRTAIFDENRQI
jgi:DNA repair exonuclease SbcCD ATPase subunit